MLDHLARLKNAARSSPGCCVRPTRIPYSEAIGFIARVDPDDEKDIDYPYYVTDSKGEPIAIERHRIELEESTFTFKVDRKPAKAGIDPLNKLIDRKPDDNTINVSIEGK